MKILTKVVNREYNKWTQDDVSDILESIDVYYNDLGLPSTCTMADIPTCEKPKELACVLVFARNAGAKYVLSNVTNPKVIPLYEKFGFTKVAEYMGGHRKRVYSLQADISGLRSRKIQLFRGRW